MLAPDETFEFCHSATRFYRRSRLSLQPDGDRPGQIFTRTSQSNCGRGQCPVERRAPGYALVRFIRNLPFCNNSVTLAKYKELYSNLRAVTVSCCIRELKGRE